MLEPRPAAGLGVVVVGSRREEKQAGGGEGRVGRSGVGRGGRRPPPLPLPGALVLALLQGQSPSQGHRPQVMNLASYLHMVHYRQLITLS
jgi:hypothetical protein